jgi:hypothetical protein
MKRLFLAVAVVLSITTFANAQTPPEIKPSPSTPVTVVNTPVPVTVPGGIKVTGDVNIANTPTVQSQQSGTWNVGISGNVNVTNTPTVQSQQSGTWNVGINGPVSLATGSTVTTLPAVPQHPFVYHNSGHDVVRAFGPAPVSTRLAITSVILAAASPSGMFFEVYADDCDGGSKVVYLYPLVPTVSSLALSFPSPLIVGMNGTGLALWCLTVSNYHTGALTSSTIVGYVLP